LRDRKAPPNKGALVTLHDEEDSDEGKRRNKGKTDKMKKGDENSLREKIDDLVN
jgi:hypothetical protein